MARSSVVLCRTVQRATSHFVNHSRNFRLASTVAAEKKFQPSVANNVHLESNTLEKVDRLWNHSISASPSLHPSLRREAVVDFKTCQSSYSRSCTYYSAALNSGQSGVSRALRQSLWSSSLSCRTRRQPGCHLMSMNVYSQQLISLCTESAIPIDNPHAQQVTLKSKDQPKVGKPAGERKDWRAGEAKLVGKVCNIVKQGKWGVDTINGLENLKFRLRAKLVNKVVRLVKDPDLAYQFFNWAGQQPAYHHNTYTYHAIIEIMGAAQKFDKQFQLLQDMRHQGYQINASTFNIFMMGYSRAKNTEGVVNIFEQMTLYGCSPNAYSFKCVIRSLVWSEKVMEALSMYRKMVEYGYVPDNFTYNGLIEGLCKAGDVNEAFSIFQEMEEQGLSPDSIAHAALIKGLDMEGRIDEACRMFQEMTGKNLRTVVNTHKGVMGVFSKRHKEELSCLQSAKAAA